MRRTDKEVTDQRIIDEIFATAEVCRIAMVDNGEPYVVPLNFGYRDNAIYVHSAAGGRKMEVLRRNRRVCFEIESPSAIVRHAEPCHWGSRSRSLIGYGGVEIITDRAQKRRGLDIIMAHYGKTDLNVYNERQLDAVVILRIPIESVACKQLGEWD
ncbi:MAG TPA: pyridoxamine 5'-phosphate oxidase family protein [Opitutaceae bacterium]|nr:pyridoxamine 5'-phosphate oxidase family protein [Opitutaceae bacterium]